MHHRTPRFSLTKFQVFVVLFCPIPMAWGTIAPPFDCFDQYSAGPPRQVNIIINAPISGISQIIVENAVNAGVSIPPLPSDFATAVMTPIDPSKLASVELQVTGGEGTIHCPAVIAGGANQWSEALPPVSGDLKVVLDQQQELEIFARGSDNSLWQAAQTSVNGPWSGWQSLGGVITGDPAPVAEQSGQIAVFAAGSDSGVWELEQTGTPPVWTGTAWSPLGGVAAGNPAAWLTPTQLGVFVRGSDLAVWEDAQPAATVGNSFPGWSPVGGYLLTDPVLVQDNNPDLYVFAQGGDGNLWMTFQAAGFPWNPWSSLGGDLFIGKPAVVRDGMGLLEVFVRGTDNAVWRNIQLPQAGRVAWAGWTSLGGNITSDPTAALNPSATGGTVEVFGRGGDNAVWRAAQTSAGGSFGAWTSFGGIVGTNLVVGTTSDNRLQLFAKAPDNSVWQIAQVFPGQWN
jgi:hypothetical protein